MNSNVKSAKSKGVGSGSHTLRQELGHQSPVHQGWESVSGTSRLAFKFRYAKVESQVPV